MKVYKTVYTTLHLNIKEPLASQLDTLAKADRRSLSQMVRVLLEFSVKAYPEALGRAPLVNEIVQEEKDDGLDPSLQVARMGE